MSSLSVRLWSKQYDDLVQKRAATMSLWPSLEKNITDLDADELELVAVQLPTVKKSMRHGSTRDVETLSYKIRRHCTATLAV